MQQHTENCSCNCLQIAESMWSMHGNYSRRQQSYYRLSSHFSKTLQQHILHGLQRQQFSIPIEISSSLSPPNQITNDKPLQCPSVYRAIATLKGSVSFWQSTNKNLQCTAWGAMPEVFNCSLEAQLHLGSLCPGGEFGRQSPQKHGKKLSLSKVEP